MDKSRSDKSRLRHFVIPLVFGVYYTFFYKQLLFWVMLGLLSKFTFPRLKFAKELLNSLSTWTGLA